MDPRLAGRVYRVAGFASLYSGDKETADRRYARAEELARQSGDVEGEGQAIMISALSMAALPELKTVIEGRLRRAIDLFAKTGSRRLIGLARNNLGEFYRSQGLYQEALTEYEACVALIPGGNQVRLTRVNIGMTRYRIGDKSGAAKAFISVLEEERRGIPSPFTVSDSLAGMAAVAEDPERAARLLGSSTKIAERAGYVREHVDQVDFDAILAEIRSNHDDESLEKSMKAGAAMDMDEAIAYALGEIAKQSDAAGAGQERA
jgi:tetratricopeptide (TPR) repeat protein